MHNYYNIALVKFTLYRDIKVLIIHLLLQRLLPMASPLKVSNSCSLRSSEFNMLLEFIFQIYQNFIHYSCNCIESQNICKQFDAYRLYTISFRLMIRILSSKNKSKWNTDFHVLSKYHNRVRENRCKNIFFFYCQSEYCWTLIEYRSSESHG